MKSFHNLKCVSQFSLSSIPSLYCWNISPQFISITWSSNHGSNFKLHSSSIITLCMITQVARICDTKCLCHYWLGFCTMINWLTKCQHNVSHPFQKPLELEQNACASPLEAYGSSVQSNVILGKCHPQANTNGVYVATLQIPNLHQAHSNLTQHTRNQQTNILDV